MRLCALIGLLLAWTASARAFPPENPYNVHVKVAYRGEALFRAGVDLVVDGAVAEHAVTPESGRVDFAGVASERFELVIKADGFFPRRVIVYNYARHDLDEDVALKRRVRWRLIGTVRGKGALIPGARVKLGAGMDQPAEAVTSPAGSFAFEPCWDTECQFSVEAPGFHRHTTWMANREQRDLAVDVELWPARDAAGPGWTRGEPERPVELRWMGCAPHAFGAEAARAALAASRRIGPAEDGPPRALTGARLTLSSGVRPRGELARVDRALSAMVLPYARRKARK